MFHEMSDESRLALALTLTDCQDLILSATDVKRKPDAPSWTMGLDGELPPGIGHAYLRIQNALGHLTAPYVASTDLIKDANGSGLWRRHASGCYAITHVAGDYHVSRYGPPGERQPLWVVRTMDNTPTEFQVQKHNGITWFQCGNNWATVLDTISKYCR